MYARRTPAGNRRFVPSHAAPRANRLKRRIAQPPTYESRPSDSCQGIGLAVGSGNAAVLSTTSRFTCGMCDSAQPKRSEEHTSELQSLMRISYAVFCLKKKKLEAN